jgi:hypothetical protein
VLRTGQVVVRDDQFGELAPGRDPGEGRADAARSHEKDSHAEDPN